VELKLNPLVLELTGKSNPRDRLEGKFSIYHAVAIALVEGAGGEKQFSDWTVSNRAVVALRGKAVPVVTPGIDPAQVDMTITLKDGCRLHRFIAHAIGGVEAPMTDKQLEAKFTDLAEGILAPTAIRRVINAYLLEYRKLPSAGELARISVSA
jgi:2-methylcitrate dehydratase PrpD